MRNIFACLVLLASFQCGFVPPTLAQDTEASADSWPQFRGPTGNGVSLTAEPPTNWSATENVAWKVEIPGNGSSSPVVLGDNVFITTAIAMEPKEKKPAEKKLNLREIVKKFDEDGDGRLTNEERRKARAFMIQQRNRGVKPQQFKVLCFDRKSGEQKWEKISIECTPSSGHHPDHGYASSTPITDGKYLYVLFGSQGLYCYDFSGELQWERTDLGTMKTRGGFGEGSSLALHEDVLVLPWDHEGESRIETIDKRTGQTKWKTARQDEPSNWATPRVVNVEGKKQIIQAGQQFMRGYDFESGEEIWRASGLTMRPVVTPVVFGKIAVFSSARGGPFLGAVKLDSQGDVTSDGFQWKIKELTPDIPSLLLSEDRLFYVAGNNGILSCSNINTGEINFSGKRLKGIRSIYSSPVAGGGKVFVTGRRGKTVVVKDAAEFEVLASNDVGEPVDATIALVGKQAFIRGRKHLFCIEEK